MENEIIVYGRPGCFQVRSTRAYLRKWAIPYRYIDIWQDADAAAFVRETNGGYESVPTLVFADGSTLTEPSQSQLKSKLEDYGMEVPNSKLVKTIDRVKKRIQLKQKGK